jgi:16S rRNA (cytidine1402-2'-O)-methyltransferase
VTGTLFVCSISIGNDADITQHVIDCLKKVDVIACEDTRVVKQLLKRLDIYKEQTLFRMDQFQEKRSFVGFHSHIKSSDVAFVSDAGTPGLSDPGSLLVNYCIEHEINIKVLPGASSLTAFIAGAGKLIRDFYFGGFMPRKQSEIEQKLNWIIEERLSAIWFESPKRILDTITCIAKVNPAIELVLAKEITKDYESYFRGQAVDVLADITNTDIRGEWVFMICGASVAVNNEEKLSYYANQMHQAGLSGQQVKAMASLLDVKKNKLYEEFNRL